jgi:hypothetical protein
MRASAALLGGTASIAVLIALALGSCGEKSSNGSTPVLAAGFVPQAPAVPNLTCAPLGAALTASGRSFYFIRLKDEPYALEQIRVERIEGSLAHLRTSVSFAEDRMEWSSVVNCESGIIVEQEAPDFAYLLWPYPGVFVGQRLAESGPGSFAAALPARRRGDAATPVAVGYQDLTVSAPGLPAVARIERRTSLGQVVEFEIDLALGPVAARFGDGSSLEIISAAQAESVTTVLREGEESERGESRLFGGGRSMTATDPGEPIPTGMGTHDYLPLCQLNNNFSYNSHWPEIGFGTYAGLVGKNTELAGDDLTALHDDRDSEFLAAPGDKQWAHDTLQIGQTTMNVEWESVMLFPKHPPDDRDIPDSGNPFASYNYPDPPPPFAANHFIYMRDISYQSPRIGDQVFVRGALIVDCGHDPAVEVHPPVAIAWSHRFGPPGIADYFLRASSYGWYPHVDNFGGAFDVDLDIPDADSAVPGTTPFLGAVTVDYTYSGYNVSDDVYSGQGAYELNHPMAHLFGGDWTQPLSNYFDVSVSLNGNKVRIHAQPKYPWDQQTDSPQRPALIGLHFMACVPIRDVNGVDLNGCVGGGGIEPPNEYGGQIRPAGLNGTLVGWVYDRHRPQDPVTVQVRAYGLCEPQDREGILTTLQANPPNFTFSYTLPPSIRVCNSPSGGPVVEIVLRTVARDDRPEEAFPELFRYSFPGLCVETPDFVSVGGLCPPGTGVNGGFRQCASGTSSLVPYCEPGLTGQPVLPPAPAGFTAAAGANQITLSWQPNNAIEYEIYSADGAYSRIGRTFSNSYSISALPNGITHSYAVSGADSIGEGPLSPVATATTFHCSQVCTSGCCTGETCTAPPTIQNGCATGGVVCRSACGPGYDMCSGGACACHQAWDLACGTKMCGTVQNACGGTYSCGTCQAGYLCSSGNCVYQCNSITCPNGCCSNGTCVAGTATGACGTGGNTCASCGLSNNTNTCANQSCTCVAKTCSRGYIWDPDTCRCENATL